MTDDPTPPPDDAALVERVAEAIMDDALWKGAFAGALNYGGQDEERNMWRHRARVAIAVCREAMVAKLGPLQDIIEASPELNMGNYDEDQVMALNNAMIEACQLLRDVLPLPPAPEPQQ